MPNSANISHKSRDVKKYETEYFAFGFYKYKKVKGQIIKQTWKWSEDGTQLALQDLGSVKT